MVGVLNDNSMVVIFKVWLSIGNVYLLCGYVNVIWLMYDLE